MQTTTTAKAKAPVRRYCEMCDYWMTHRECPECGMPTVKGVR
jgi:ribosomal protein L32